MHKYDFFIIILIKKTFMQKIQFKKVTINSL